MELGNKIKSLRLKSGMTQEMLATELGVTFQTISKWENNVCTPDIAMLPRLSVYFGVTIDELFDLTTNQKLHRIENMLDLEQEIPHNTFIEIVDFIKSQLDGECDKGKMYDFLAHIYHHRMISDSEKVKMYVRKALQFKPTLNDVQWLLQKAEGAAVTDWNIRNHSSLISFYRELVKENKNVAHNYLHLIDNLLADNRIEEANEYLELYMKCEGSIAYKIMVCEGKIAMAQHNTSLAKEIYTKLEKDFPDNGDAMFAIANYYADICEYDKAISYYSKSFELDKIQQKKPLYIDALQGIALIYEIQEKYDAAIKTYDEILQVYREEHGWTEGEPVRVIIAKKQRLLENK